ncbi:hypothetical protein ACGFW5_26350 [Streptomyces sp. NPDC048416]|uniref:hypothetical protein n=1 Tax=Streptomyces sp. NPDC048416 TaxID=3365546 RepID=UPI00371D764E
MSGPLRLEPPDGRDDTLMLRLATESTMTLRLPRLRSGRRGKDAAVDRLAAELAEQIGPAVHAYEVAALLESEGLTAQQIADEYGHGNLFSLAEDLYGRVPRSFPEPPPATDPWAPQPVRCALRGALFALPGLAYPLTARLWQSDRAVLALIVAGLISWAWGQGLGHRAYLRMASGRPEAARTLLAGAPLGALLACVSGLAIVGPARADFFVAGQSCYLAAAGILLVLARERLLLAALTPLIAGAAVLPFREPGAALRIGLCSLALVLVLAAVWHCLRDILKQPASVAPVSPRLVASLPYGLFGLAAGVLVAFAGQRHPLAVIALTLSMGPAEWLLYRFRGLSVAALRATATPTAFRWRSAAVLGGCLLVYLLPLIPAALLTGAEPAPLLALAALLWTALLLQAFGIAWLPAVVSLAAAVGVAAFGLLVPPPGPLAELILCSAAAAVLTGTTLHLLGRATAHA